MKLLPGSISCLLFLLLLVELPILATPHPTPMRPHKDGLTKLFQKMRRLIHIVHGVVQHHDGLPGLPLVQNLTSLPALNFRPKDLAAVEANSTLSKLSFGLHSFKLHFDWLLYWHTESGLVSNRIKEIADEIQSVIILAQKQTNSPAPDTVLSLPPLKSAWEIHMTSTAISRRLQDFCSWYSRALLVLMSAKN